MAISKIDQDGIELSSLNVDGTVTADGLTVDGDMTMSDARVDIFMMESDTTDVNTNIAQNGGGLSIRTVSDDKSTDTTRFFLNHSTGDISFYEDTGTTPKLFWDASAERLGIGTSIPSEPLHVYGSALQKILIQSTASGAQLILQSDNGSTADIMFGDTGDVSRGLIRYDNSNESIQFWNNNLNERMRLDSSGNLIIGSTSDTGTGYHFFDEDGFVRHVRDNSVIMVLDRKTSTGDIVLFRKDNSTVGSIGTQAGDLYIANSVDVGLYFESSGTDHIAPCNQSGTKRDNAIDLGASGTRFNDAYITNGVTTGSDRNEKQDIATLTTAEMAVAARLSNQFKTFRWIDSVTEKGDNARTHTGIIAQDVQQAFTDEGLDAGDYALFISSTWWETQTEVPAVEAVDEVLDEDGNVITEAVEAQEAYTRTDTYGTADEAPEGATERTRLGIRYPELLSFMQAYNDQRMASIEARLDALEAN